MADSTTTPVGVSPADVQGLMDQLNSEQLLAEKNNATLALRSIKTNEFETALQTAEGLAMNAAKNKPQV